MAQEALAKTKGVADIVFLIDITGSMQPCIDALRSNISTFVNGFAQSDANGGSPVKDWRIKVTGYRDSISDGSQWLIDFPFTNDVDEVIAQLEALEAKGGGDEPESLLDALYYVATMSATERGEVDPEMWRDRHEAARVVIFFTDATYHPTISAADGKGGTVVDVIREIQSARIILAGFTPEHDCYYTLGEADKSMIEFVGPLSEAVESMNSFTSDPANFRQVLLALAKTVSQSADTVPQL
jgi:hypothetical protein